jgi:hypothetical protein
MICRTSKVWELLPFRIESQSSGNQKEMNDTHEKYPDCFGHLETVFPKGSDDLRSTPERCLECAYKTACLRSAMEGSDGLKVRGEIVDRAYQSGILSFFQRWSQKKNLQRRLNKKMKP